MSSDEYITWYCDNHKTLHEEYLNNKLLINWDKFIKRKWEEVNKDEINIGEMETINTNI